MTLAIIPLTPPGVTITPDILYIDAQVRGLPATQRLLDQLSGVQHEIIQDVRTLQVPSDLQRAKRQWLVTHFARSWIHRTHEDNGTTTFVTDVVTNTPYNCSYSPLPVQLAKQPFLSLMTDFEEIIFDLGRRGQAHPAQKFVVRCGELGDALAIDHIMQCSATLVPYFAYTPNATLELWTRTANVDHLLTLTPAGKTAVVFAMSPEIVIAREEHGTASLTERIAAARRLAEAGYKIIYSLDPVMQYDGWETDYDALIDQLLLLTPRSALERIELSCLHYPRGLSAKSLERFPDSRIFFGELVPVNGSYRYFRPVRQQMYRYLIASIHLRAMDLPVHVVNEHGALTDWSPTETAREIS